MTMVRTLASALTLLVVAAPIPADARRLPEPTVASFLAKHNRLSHSKKEMQPAFVFHEARLVLNQIYTAGGKAVLLNQRALKEGRAPLFCSPYKGGALGLNIEELHAFFETIPADRRSQSLNDGIIGFARSKYPCPAAPAASPGR
jgi:hypothetical protein